MCCKDINFIVELFDLWNSCKCLQNFSHICNYGFIFWVLEKAVSLRFNDIRFTVVSFIMMEEVSYTDFILRFKYKSFTVAPSVMINEVCCMGVTANPRFDVQKCCVVACKRNHFYFLFV